VAQDFNSQPRNRKVVGSRENGRNEMRLRENERRRKKRLKGEGRNVSYGMSRDRKLDRSCEVGLGWVGFNLTGTRRKKFPAKHQLLTQTQCCLEWKHKIEQKLPCLTNCTFLISYVNAVD